MSEVFGEVYADAYDLLYADKDYAGECAMIGRAFDQFAVAPVHSILDLGCGTGNHAIPLARKGYRVVGVDRSARMLAHAREKAEREFEGRVAPRFVEGDIRSAAVDETFDAVVMMFNVLGYLLEDDDAIAALCTARNHLKPDGLLICDFWYGPAVARSSAQDRHKVFTTQQERIIRLTSTEVDATRRICDVRFRLWRLQGDRVAGETDERHRVRFFFPDELRQMFATAGFSLRRLGGFPDFNIDPDPEGSWTVTAIGSAVAAPG